MVHAASILCEVSQAGSLKALRPVGISQLEDSERPRGQKYVGSDNAVVTFKKACFQMLLPYTFRDSHLNNMNAPLHGTAAGVIVKQGA